MIGRIEFPRVPDDGTILSATLEDGKGWACADKKVQELSDLRAPSVEGYMPVTTQLHMGLDVLPVGAKIVEEIEETVVPGRVYRRRICRPAWSILRIVSSASAVSHCTFKGFKR